MNEKNREIRENYRKVSALMRRKRMERMNGNFPDTQNRVLTILAKSDGIFQRELAYILGIRPQSAGELVRKLENLELVYRVTDENDGRAHKVFLTEKGKDESEKIAAAREQHSIFDCLDDEEKDQLNSLLAKIVDNSPKYEEQHLSMPPRFRRHPRMEHFPRDDRFEDREENGRRCRKRNFEKSFD